MGTFSTLLISLFLICPSSLIRLIGRNHIAAIGEPFVPALFVKVIFYHFRAFFKAVDSPVKVIALCRKASVAAVLPTQLVFGRAFRRGKP